MRIFQLSLDDVRLLYNFYNNLSPAVSETYRPFCVINTAVMSEHLTGASEGKHISLAIEEAEQIVGHSFIINIDQEHPVFGIGISDVFHRRGWGRSLMKQVLAEGQSRGINHITLTVLKYNTAALSLYKSFGFKTVSDHTFKQKNDSYFMTREGVY